jgi:hypothetical protein
MVMRRSELELIAKIKALVRDGVSPHIDLSVLSPRARRIVGAILSGEEDHLQGADRTVLDVATGMNVDDDLEVLVERVRGLRSPLPDGGGSEILLASRVVSELEAELRAGRAALIPAPLEVIRDAVGWRRGDLALLVGFPGTGKTALLMQSALCAAEQGYEVHIVSAQMSRLDIAARLVGPYLRGFTDPDGSPLTVSRLIRRDPNASGALMRIVEEHGDILGRISIDAMVWPTLDMVLSAIYSRNVTRSLDLVLVDRLWAISASASAPQSREVDVGEVADSLARLARQLDAAVVAADGAIRTEASRPSVVRAAHAAALALEIRRGEHATGATKWVEHELEVLKSHDSGAIGKTVRLMFDGDSCTFDEAPW